MLTVFRSLAKNCGQINFSLIKRVFHCRFPDITLVVKGLSPVLKEFKKIMTGLNFFVETLNCFYKKEKGWFSYSFVE